jgi:nucleoside-diphosphate-sugar epimerase|tara:strand:- start:392 stop:1309 length:918 start_codon:yes stop_codon:yes gene_type:complete
MKILITGGAGYFGVMLTKALLEKGHYVTILDIFMYGYDSVLHLMGYDKFQVVQQDIRNDIKKQIAEYDAIYHLAGISGYPACEANPNSAELINVVATRHLVDALSKDQLLIYASTTSFYGKSGAVLDEFSQIDPVSLYGITKYKAEQISMQKDNSVALRFATIFGVSPKMRIDLLVNDFVYKAVNERCIVLFEASTKRTFLHIKDAIHAYVMALERIDDMKNQIYNVGSNDMNYTKLEISKKIQEYTQCSVIESEIEDLDLRNFVISFDKIYTLGFRSRYTLDCGIKELLKLYRFYKPLLPYKTI